MSPDDLATIYRRFHGRVPDLVCPRLFTEKVQYRKLFDRDPRFVSFSDKIAVKAEIEKLLGSEWLIPTFWRGHRMPREGEQAWPVPHVAKASHASGWNHFVLEAITAGDGRALYDRWLGATYGQKYGEWLYSQIRPGLIVEPYYPIAKDYKLYVFGGRVEYVHVVDGGGLARAERTCRCYDRSWRPQPFTYGHYALSDVDLAPYSWSKMIEAAELLGTGFDFVRVDLYEVGRKPLFGELTFYPSSGLDQFHPADYDSVFGALWAVWPPSAH
jgi:hypothetical protein